MTAEFLDLESIIASIPALSDGEINSLLPVFVAALSRAVIPDQLPLKNLIDVLMPSIFGLRNKGCSFELITELLKKVGVKLQPGTVKMYYNAYLNKKDDDREVRMMATLKKVVHIDNAIHRFEAALKVQDHVNVADAISALFNEIAEAEESKQDKYYVISLHLPDALKHKIKSAATAQNISMSNFIQNTLEQQLRTAPTRS